MTTDLRYAMMFWQSGACEVPNFTSDDVEGERAPRFYCTFQATSESRPWRTDRGLSRWRQRGADLARASVAGRPTRIDPTPATPNTKGSSVELQTSGNNDACGDWDSESAGVRPRLWSPTGRGLQGPVHLRVPRRRPPDDQPDRHRQWLCGPVAEVYSGDFVDTIFLRSPKTTSSMRQRQGRAQRGGPAASPPASSPSSPRTSA